MDKLKKLLVYFENDLKTDKNISLEKALEICKNIGKQLKY